MRWALWEYAFFGALVTICSYATFVYLVHGMYLFGALVFFCAVVSGTHLVVRLACRPIESRIDKIVVTGQGLFAWTTIPRANIEKVVERRSYSPLIGRRSFVDDVLIVDSEGKERAIARLWEGEDWRGVRTALQQALPSEISKKADNAPNE